MARYTESVCKQCRSAGIKLFLKGSKCNTAKCPVSRRAYKPGMHGQGKRVRLTDYGIRLAEKQKARRVYGMMETQFFNTFVKASKKSGVTGEVFLQLLEKRLDNVAYRLGLAPSRAAARQFVLHGGLTLNGKKVNIPSLQVRIGDKVAVVSSFKAQAENNISAMNRAVPSWLSFEAGTLSASITSEPNRTEIDTPVQENLIVEFYSR